MGVEGAALLLTNCTPLPRTDAPWPLSPSVYVKEIALVLLCRVICSLSDSRSADHLP